MAAISGRVLISTGMPVLNSFDGDALETLRIFRRPAVISLSDDELRAIMAAASPLRPRDRDAFLLDVAAELAKRAELGPGIVARLARELQRRHFDPPNLKGATLRVPPSRRAVAICQNSPRRDSNRWQQSDCRQSRARHSPDGDGCRQPRQRPTVSEELIAPITTRQAPPGPKRSGHVPGLSLHSHSGISL
jgi:hypothetical protein